MFEKLKDVIFDNPLFPEMEAPSNARKLAWLMAIATVGSVCGFLPLWLQTVYFIGTSLSFLYLLSNGIQINGRFMALYIVLILNVLILPIDPIFNSKMRLLLFTVVTMVVSSAVTTPTAVTFRYLLFKDIILLCSVLVPASFLCRFVGLNFVRASVFDLSVDQQIETVGLFGGLFSSSMVLGLIAAPVAITFFFAYQSFGQKKIYILLFITSTVACFFSASRAALLSLVVPIAFALISNKGREGAQKSTRNILIISLLAIIPFADTVVSGVVQKQKNNVEMGSTFGSRDDKLTCRWAEFTSSPILGVGFASVDPNGKDEYGSDGTIEPGSSHVAVLSMTGLLGSICYLSILIYAYWGLKNEDDTIARYRKTLLIALLLHACWEGYVFSGGGFMCLLYWIVIGQAIDYKYIKKYGLIEDEYYNV
mgnify:CR=1 FL=1